VDCLREAAASLRTLAAGSFSSADRVAWSVRKASVTTAEALKPGRAKAPDSWDLPATDFSCQAINRGNTLFNE